jgi:hypothetical protein
MPKTKRSDLLTITTGYTIWRFKSDGISNVRTKHYVNEFNPEQEYWTIVMDYANSECHLPFDTLKGYTMAMQELRPYM